MTETPKTSIGGYAISRRLPGPGETYQARSPSGDRVLVRVLPRPADEQAWEQLKQDIAVCRRLDHPAIPKPSDVFEEGASLVVVDAYFEGSKLQALMRRPVSRTKLQGPAAWHIARELTGALALAHTAVDEAGVPAAVCHGHLNPAQVLVSVEGVVRLEGLGLGALAGTPDAPAVPGFQPPEEAKGGRITPRGDLYSAAAILWALLTTSEPVADGSKLDLGRIEKLAPPAVVAILRLALEPSVGKRKITAMEVEAAVAEAYDRAAGQAAVAGAARALAQSGRTLVGTGGLATGVASPGLGLGAIAAGGQAPAGPAAAAEPAAPAPGEPARAASGAAVLGPGMRRAGAAPAAAPAPAGIDKEAETPFVATAGLGGIEPKAVARASVGGPSKGLRQRTLLGSWMNTAAAQQDAAASSPKAPEVPDRAAAEDRPSPPKRTTAPTPVPAKQAASPAARPVVEPTAATPDQRGTVDSFDSVDLEAAMLGATVTADARTELPVDLARPSAEEPTDTAESAAIPLPRPAVTPVPKDSPEAPGGAAPLANDLPEALEAATASPESASLETQGPPTAIAAQPSAVDTAGSAWSPAAAPRATVTDGRPLSWGAAIAIAIATAALTMGVGIWWTRRQVGLVEVIPPAASAPTSASASSAPSSSAAASAEVVASAAAASADASAAPADPLAGADGKSLPADRGLLRVEFAPAEGAEVFVYGKSFGPVGQHLDVPCGRRFIRVGKMPGPSWLSKGESVDIACQSVTSIKLAAP